MIKETVLFNSYSMVDLLGLYISLSPKLFIIIPIFFIVGYFINLMIILGKWHSINKMAWFSIIVKTLVILSFIFALILTFNAMTLDSLAFYSLWLFIAVPLSIVCVFADIYLFFKKSKQTG